MPSPPQNGHVTQLKISDIKAMILQLDDCLLSEQSPSCVCVFVGRKTKIKGQKEGKSDVEGVGEQDKIVNDNSSRR